MVYDLKHFYKATVIRIVWYRNKTATYINGIEQSPEMNS